MVEAFQYENWSNPLKDDVQTWMRELRELDWRHPLRSFHHFALARREAINTAKRAVPLLTSLRRLTISTVYWCKPLSHASSYHGLLAHVPTDNLQRLDLHIHSIQSLHLLSYLFESLKISFGSIQTLQLYIHIPDLASQHLAKHIRALVEPTRRSLRTLVIRFSAWHQNHLVQFFRGLGHFHRLAHVDFDLEPATDASFVSRLHHDFLVDHRATLLSYRQAKFTLAGNATPTPWDLSQWRSPNLYLKEMAKDRPDMPLPHLTTLALTCSSSLFRLPLTALPTFQPFADTLTTLVLHTERFRFFWLDEIEIMVKSLCRQPPAGTCALENFAICIQHLSPETLDFLARVMGNLRALEIRYKVLVRDRLMGSQDVVSASGSEYQICIQITPSLSFH